MIRRFCVSMLLLVFCFLGLIFSKSTLAQDTAPTFSSVSNISSFELFWPIVAGRVSGEPLYPLKIFKEKIKGVLIFRDIKKSEYNLFISEKRVVEFEKLSLVNKDFVNAAKTLDVAKFYHSKTLSYLEKAKVGGKMVGPTRERIIMSFNNQILLLKDIASKVNDDQKQSLTEVIFSLGSEIEKLKE
ncbi:MAG: DUF5667 domain-containing protein [bacterium]